MTPSPIFDFVPPGTPPITNPAIESAIADVHDRGLGATAWEVLLDEQINQLRVDPEFGERLRTLYADAGVNLICPTVWSTDPRLSYREGTYHDLSRWEARFETLDWLHKVTTPCEARQVVGDGDVGMILGTQNLGAFTAGDPELTDTLYNAGIRIMQLAYYKQNHAAAGCTEVSGSGQTAHGRELVHRMNELGAVIDLSHCNKATTLETVAASDAPVAYTHTNCGALHDVDRAKSDAELEALADNDGYMGVLVYPTLYETPTFETFFDHLEHAISILGSDRIGIATDWSITTPDVPESVRSAILHFFDRVTHSSGVDMDVSMFENGFESMREYTDRPVIRSEFEARGYSDEDIRGFFGENFLAFWERVRAHRV